MAILGDTYNFQDIISGEIAIDNLKFAKQS